MTNFEHALQIIENTTGITAAQLAADKAAYIAVACCICKWVVLGCLTVLLALAVIDILAHAKRWYCADDWGLALYTCGFVLGLAALIAGICWIGWLRTPDLNYADHILGMAKDYLS